MTITRSYDFPYPLGVSYGVQRNVRPMGAALLGGVVLTALVASPTGPTPAALHGGTSAQATFAANPAPLPNGELVSPVRIQASGVGGGGIGAGVRVTRTPPIKPLPLLDFAVPRGAGHTIYLTFDDGPDAKWTPMVLRLLRKFHVPATFFVIGYQVKDHPGLVLAEHAAGYPVENHTEDHADLTHVPANKLLTAQIKPVDRALQQLIGVTPQCLRPPYGAFNAAVRAAASSVGLHLALWDIDTLDWSRPGVNAIVSSVLSSVHPGAVILMHDGGGDRSQTVAAVAALLPRLLAAHWKFGTICG